jgi:CRP-like cAMP-binding protein
MQHTGNYLLDLLPPAVLDGLRPYLAGEVLSLNRTLQARGKPVKSVFFPTSGMISIVAMLRDGASVEVGIAGREGMLGVQAVLGDDISLNEAMVQIPGSALRMPADVLRREAQASPELRAVLLRYVQAVLNSATQSAACNRAHLLEQRLARWLLTARDRAGTDRLPLTHEFIAMMLGVRRAGVTVAAQSLQTAGLIQYVHGRITIADREGLEVAACECYEVTRREYARLLGIPAEEIRTEVLEYQDHPPPRNRMG